MTQKIFGRSIARVVWCGLCLSIVVLCAAPVESQQENKKTSPQVKIEPIVDNLDLPFSVVVHPKNNELFVAESGAGKIIRIVNNIPQDDIIDFATGEVVRKSSSGDKKFKIGPVSLSFVSDKILVVGTAGNQDFGKDKLQIFKIMPTPEKYQDASKAVSSESIPARRKEPAEGQFFSLAMSGDYVYAISRGNEEIGWLCRGSIKNDKFSTVRRYTEINEVSKSTTPSAITFSPRGEIVVASSGKPNDDADCIISFFKVKASEAEHLQNFTVSSLRDIVSLQYSPSGDLYALDMSWSDPAKGGLYKIVAGTGSQCTAKKIADLNGPTSMAFAKNGDLYVTVTNGLKPKKGQLLKITGLQKPNQ